MNNYDYPMGADTKDAPWNEEENVQREFEVTITCALNKDVTVHTSDYDLEVDKDEDGTYEILHTEDINWKNVYNKEHLTIEELLKEFSEVLKYHLDSMDNLDSRRANKYKYLLKECSNWTTHDLEVVNWS
jgi:hypothetical protein